MGTRRPIWRCEQAAAGLGWDFPQSKAEKIEFLVQTFRGETEEAEEHQVQLRVVLSAKANLEKQAKVQKTLEGLLSKKNLVRDQFLAGNMNPQRYIPIGVLVAHEKLAAVGATEELVIGAATASTRL